MATISFTDNLKRHVDCPPKDVQAATVRDALRQLFAENPRLGSYILDDQDRLRRHVAIFVDGRLVRDRAGLSDPLRPDSRVDVMQALSGG